jgi:hypothetical protein
MKLLSTITLLVILISQAIEANQYSFRKYSHVKRFYKEIYKKSIAIGLKSSVPPAAIMAIAGLESGYGSGYISQITGNILSLGAYKSDAELPSLYLPYLKSKKIPLFDPIEIAKHKKNDLLYKQRPKSYKRDYRPAPFAGTIENLELLKYNTKLKEKAYGLCINDFTSRWINENSKIKVFKNTRLWLNKKIFSKGTGILLTKKLNKEFIYKIGGVPNSFNYRKTWPKKVNLIMQKVGLVELVYDIEINKKSFNEAWSKNDE